MNKISRNMFNQYHVKTISPKRLKATLFKCPLKCLNLTLPTNHIENAVIILFLDTRGISKQKTEIIASKQFCIVKYTI